MFGGLAFNLDVRLERSISVAFERFDSLAL